MFDTCLSLSKSVGMYGFLKVIYQNVGILMTRKITCFVYFVAESKSKSKTKTICVRGYANIRGGKKQHFACIPFHKIKLIFKNLFSYLKLKTEYIHFNKTGECTVNLVQGSFFLEQLRNSLITSYFDKLISMFFFESFLSGFTFLT